MSKGRKIQVKQTDITVILKDDVDFISLTDMTMGFNEGSGLIGKWITNKNTLEYLGTWERINNPNFNYPEFGVIEKDAGVNRFIMSVGQWIDRTHASGMLVKAGRYGGTYAHKDIAFHFAMWLSPEFQIYLVREFQRLKEDENDRLNLTWNLHRTLSKINYRIHTDAIKEHIIPNSITKEQANLVYASEADVLNVALFGKTAKQWRDENPNADGNVRDQATIEQLLVLANIESMNAEFIKMNLPQSERLLKLNQIAISQLKSIVGNTQIKKLK
ncbi:MAG: KilA-N domain-containing protein [Saprospiraceae bacterium]